MGQTPTFDLNEAHTFFSADCFNRAWDLIDKKDRTDRDTLEMIAASYASLWHWTKRPDCADQNLSISYWQLSRVFALAGQADNARAHAKLSLSYSERPEVAPFYLGYSYEALARAEAMAGNRKERDRYVRQARQILEKVTDEESKKLLAGDLATIP